MARWVRREESWDGIPERAAGPRPAPHDLLPQRPFVNQPRAPGRDFEAEPLVGVLGAAGNTVGDQLTAWADTGMRCAGSARASRSRP